MGKQAISQIRIAYRFATAALLLALASCGGKTAEIAGGDGSTSAGDGDGSVPNDASSCREAGATLGAPEAIPLGTYTECYSAVFDWGGIASTGDPLGWGAPEGTITLSAAGDVLKLDVNKGVFAFAAGSLAFMPITAGSAVIAPNQTYGLLVLGCATSTITSGALALNGDRLLVSLVGKGCGSDIASNLSCAVPTQPTGTLGQPSRCGDPGPSAFPVGTYVHCTVLGDLGPTGRLELTQSHDVLTIATDDLMAIAPASTNLEFTANSSRSATIVPGQTWLVNLPGASVPTVPGTMNITGGSLVVDGSKLFVFVSGAIADETQPFDETFYCTAGE